MQMVYEAPTITYHGDVATLTQSELLHLGASGVRFAATFANSIVVPQSPGEGATTTTVVPDGGGGAGGPVVPQDVSPGGPSDVTDTVGGGNAPAGGAPSGGGASPGGGSGAAPAAAGGGNLPFTGFAVMFVAGAGAAVGSAGMALRRFARRL
jgi:hypothetical protein